MVSASKITVYTTIPLLVLGYGSYYPGYGPNSIVEYDAPTCSSEKCWRRDIIVTQDIQFTLEFHNQTMVQSVIISGPANASFTPKLDPYIVINTTTVEYSVTDLYYYTWSPPKTDLSLSSYGCPECNLALKNDTDPSPYPLVGCDEYQVTKIPGRNSAPTIKSEVSYIFL